MESVTFFSFFFFYHSSVWLAHCFPASTARKCSSHFLQTHTVSKNKNKYCFALCWCKNGGITQRTEMSHRRSFTVRRWTDRRRAALQTKSIVCLRVSFDLPICRRKWHFCPRNAWLRRNESAIFASCSRAIVIFFDRESSLQSFFFCVHSNRFFFNFYNVQLYWKDWTNTGRELSMRSFNTGVPW